jgi:hypothetical protein
MSDLGVQMGEFMNKSIGEFYDMLPEGKTRVDFDGTVMDVTKLSAYVPVSDELVHPEAYPPVRYSWYTRLRWWISDWREKAGVKVGSWIAGRDLKGDDYW